MKTLQNPKITCTGDQITIVCDVKDVPFDGLLITRVSHVHFNPENTKHPRRVQSSNAAVFMEYPGGKFAMPNDIFRQIAAHACPESSFPPHFKDGSNGGSVKICSETPYHVQWQVSDNPKPIATKSDTPPPPAIWTDIDGATGETLDESKVADGKWVRCVATNASGVSISPPAKKKT